MLSVDAWIGMRDLDRRGVSVSEIARQTGHDRKTVRKVLTATAPPVERKPAQGRGSKLDAFREYIEQRVSEGCLNGNVLLDELRARGYGGKISILRGILTPVRQELRRQREATERYETGPGKQGQVDWGEFGKLWVPDEERGRTVYGFVFTLGHSRAQYLEFVLCCDLEHFLACHLNAFAALGIPEKILSDNLKTGIIGRRPDGTPILPGRFADFALYYGFTPTYCAPYRPQTKGKVERGVGYAKHNFWVRGASLVARKDLALDGLNEQARSWSGGVANVRVHGTHGEVVAVRSAREAALLGKLDTRPRYAVGYTSVRRVGRDGRLSYGGQVYAVALEHALREVTVHESLAGAVTMRTKEGAVLRPTDGMPPVGQAASPRRDEPRSPVVALVRHPHLQVVPREAPLVETRDLAVYEEVARAIRGG
jgi:transposase